jgi:hypothetical protein
VDLIEIHVIHAEPTEASLAGLAVWLFLRIVPLPLIGAVVAYLIIRASL